MLDLHVPAAAEALSPMRQAVRAWLRELGIGQRETDEILVVCNEVCSNAIEHGRAEGEDEIHLTGMVRDGVLRVDVRDHGRWRNARPSGERGQGLRIVRIVMDKVAIRRHTDGTEVVMHRRLRAPAAAPGRLGGASPAA
jgi:anti-sigma regulatory factor (Ser/Thr protein kinase)